MKTNNKVIIAIVAAIAIFSSFFSVLSINKVKAEENSLSVLTLGKDSVDMDAMAEEKLTNVHYIENANYFITNPKHAENDTADNAAGTCTSVAVQMLMGYHNYYNDRRLIPATDEKGNAFLSVDYAKLTSHPDIDTSITGGLGRKETGTEDQFFEKLLEMNTFSWFPGLGQSYGSVLSGADAFIKKYASDIAEDVPLQCWDIFDSDVAKAELDSGNPLIVGRGQLEGMNFHVMVAYGYATYEGEEGYIVHMGYYSNKTRYWVPRSLLVFMAKIVVNHTHNFVDSGRYVNDDYREVVCSVCGANTLESIYTTEIGKNTITGLKYPFRRNNVTIPSMVMNGNSAGKMIKKNVDSIYKEAFANTMSDGKAYSVTVSQAITSIGDETFKNCTSLNSVQFGSAINNIGLYAFKGCDSLKRIDIPYTNSYYISESGVLYNEDKSVLLWYPAGKTDEVFSIDMVCEEIASYAFANNANLQTLNLVNTKIINRYSIKNCPSLSTITAPNLDISYPSAITGTKFTDETADIIFGTILFKKTSAGETVEIDENIKTIAPEAFVGNESIKKLVARGHNFRKIGDNAFKNCSTLGNIEIYNLNEVVGLGTGALDGVSTNLKIKVPQKYLNTYKTETAKGWTSFANNFAALDKHSVKYVVGGKVVKESFVDYGNEIGEDYKYIDDSEAYYAKTWKTADGTEIKGYHTITDDIVLYGELAPYTFTITYVTNGGKPIAQGKYNVENDKELLEATRDGYTFKGWYTSPDLAEESKIDLIIRKGTRTGNLTVYAKWQANTYTVAFETVVDEQILPEQHVVFGEPFAFGVAYSDGRIFNGWKDEDGRMLTGHYGDSNFVWDIPNQTTVFADWTLIEYTITYPNADMPNNPTKFTVEDLPIVLQQATLRAARNDGWYLDESCTLEKIEEINELGDITLYAKWAYLVIIDFELNGGDWGDQDTYYIPNTAFSGDEITLPRAERNGYNRGCWNCNGSNVDFGDSFNIPDNINMGYFKFTAVWSDPNTYTVRFNWGEVDEENDAPKSIRILYDTIAPEIKLPKKAGFILAKCADGEKVLYRTNAQNKLECLRFDFAGDITLTAEWVSPYPELKVVGKQGGKWQINIKNNTHLKLTFTYNGKMCFEKDAKAWSGLSDQHDITIESKKDTTVDIAENWFAACVVVSVKIDQRYITYAYNLDSNTKTLTPVNCYVSA